MSRALIHGKILKNIASVTWFFPSSFSANDAYTRDEARKVSEILGQILATPQLQRMDDAQRQRWVNTQLLIQLQRQYLREQTNLLLHDQVNQRACSHLFYYWRLTHFDVGSVSYTHLTLPTILRV